ncbi:MAG: High confidence in function and specificity [Planctomycetota bacterium]|jgi:ATP-dependent RNA helicase DeaD
MSIEPDSAPEAENPESAAPAVHPFAAVPDTLHAALARKGFEKLTTVQQALLAADDGVRDLRISSQTGSGKTVAIGFALAPNLHNDQRRGPTTLIVAPTRELAVQVRDELSWLFADLRGCVCEVVIGGANIARERQRLAKRPEVLVGTPGRLLDHIRNGALDLSSVRQLVLDEADQMLDLGFKDELDEILSHLPAERRTHLVSATFAQAVVELADRFQNRPILVAGQKPGAAHADIEHIAVRIPARGHLAALVNLLLVAGDDRTLVFVRTREDTATLADKLAADGFTALPISGDLAQAQRTRTLAAFKRGAVRTLIATDVAARGLDISDVTMVVHIDPPMDAETYVHRSGRTGRAGQKGKSVMLALKSHEGKLRRIYAQARVQPTWAWPPSPDAVMKRQMERAEKHATAAIAAHTLTEEQRSVAQHLLRDRDPVDVVAALLIQAGQGPREPFAFAGMPMSAPTAPTPIAHVAKAPSAPAPVAAAPVAKPYVAKAPVAQQSIDPEPIEQQPVAEAAIGQEPSNQTPMAKAPAAGKPARERKKPSLAEVGLHETEPRVPEAPVAQPPSELMQEPEQRVDRRPLPTRGKALTQPTWKRERGPAEEQGAGEGGAEQGFLRFSINWGLRDGADARRILAHVCRRGGIDSQMIGHIELRGTLSLFDVRTEAAIGFGRRVQARDRRDPHLRITRWHERQKPDRPGRAHDAGDGDFGS